MSPAVLTTPLTVYVLDVFTAPGLSGNPAAVVLCEEELDDHMKSRVAQELNEVATAFISHHAILSPEFATLVDAAPSIAWYAATGKALPLCGHASMAASTLLLEHLFPSIKKLTYMYGGFKRAPSTLTAWRARDGRIAVRLPATKTLTPLVASDWAVAASGILAASDLKVEDIVALVKSPSNDPDYFNLLVHLDSKVDLEALRVTPSILGSIPYPYRGYYFTSAWPPSANGEPRPPSTFRSRVFFPVVGILEDQVCGSAHALMGPYWASTSTADSEMREEDGHSWFALEGKQVSKRGGEVGMLWDGKWGEMKGCCCILGRSRVVEKKVVHV